MVPGCGAGALSLLLLVLAEGQALALWSIPRQLRQRTMRDKIQRTNIYEGKFLKFPI